jgi:cell division transport system ATP-binding protein
MKVHGNSTKGYQSSDKPIIEFINVTKNYTKDVPALNGINLQIQKGEFVFIVGPSGSGKSTLIKLMLKELDPTTGEIKIKNNSVRKISRKKLPYYRRDIGVVFQDFRLLPDRTVYENVAFAQQVIEAPSSLIKRRVPAMLSEVYLVGKGNAYPNELSGGEQQRVAIARALVNQPSILLCDEPTGNLDPENSITVMKTLEHANKMGTTVVVVTHNMEIVQQMRKRTITMSQGKIINDVAKGGYFYED